MKVRIAVSIPPIVPIRIGGPRGTKDVDALLDTGATYCIVSREDARQLGYQFRTADQVPVATAGGVIRVPRITLTAVEVLGLRRVRVPALVKDLAESGFGSDYWVELSGSLSADN